MGVYGAIMTLCVLSLIVALGLVVGDEIRGSDSDFDDWDM